MPAEPKGDHALRTLRARVTPDHHAQLSMVAQVDGGPPHRSPDGGPGSATLPSVGSPRTSRPRPKQALEVAQAQMAQDQGHAARHVARGSAYGVSPAGLRRLPQAGVDARKEPSG